ncbi:MAG: CPBP family glutamic-type intramembrane protease [Actinomycetia bacterium]|nr:CPBP family glutamic-type intramembrane protease [Actinomycetes bacterium]
MTADPNCTPPGPTWPIIAIGVVAPVVTLVIALLGGPWQVAAVAHLGALAYWRWGEQKPWRGLVAAPGRHRLAVLVAVGALVPAVTALASWSAEGLDRSGVLLTAGWSGVGRALLLALLIGVGLNAVPEEVTKFILLTAARRRWGAVVAVAGVTAFFTAMHVPNWMTSQMPASTWVFQVVSKLAFGALTGWSAVRLRSLGFALGYHVGGNLVGTFLDLLGPPDGWQGLTPVSTALLVLEMVACVVLVRALAGPAHSDSADASQGAGAGAPQG